MRIPNDTDPFGGGTGVHRKNARKRFNRMFDPSAACSAMHVVYPNMRDPNMR